MRIPTTHNFMKSYIRNITKTGTINCNEATEGEHLETKVNRITQNKEAIKDAAPPIYTDRKDGVLAETNIRTDRWEVAADAMDKVTGTHRAKRDERLKAIKGGEEPAKPTGTDGGEAKG